jgi:hypothetical protein
MLERFKKYYCNSYLYAFIFILLGGMAYQYHCQHKELRKSIETYDTNIKLYQEKMDEVIEHHNKMFNICDSLINLMDSLPLGSPLDTLIISSNFGSRKNSTTKRWEYHSGTDFLATPWDTVYATGDGIIEKSQYNSGDLVKRGDPIGTAGNTGHSRGYHLHYEISRYGNYTDPKKYINL